MAGLYSALRGELVDALWHRAGAKTMVVRKSEFRAAVDQGCTVRVVGDQGGGFVVICEPGGTLADGDKHIEFPSLNHVADYLQRQRVTEFAVDVSLWRDADTGRSRSVGRP